MRATDDGGAATALAAVQQGNYIGEMTTLTSVRGDAPVATPPSGPIPTIFEAIVRKRCLLATYNRDTAMIAPHIVYTRHDELFIDAVVVERSGRPPREPKVGTYKLAGLSDLRIVDRPFQPSPLFEPQSAKYAGNALVAVDFG